MNRTVLLVEDESQLRSLLALALASLENCEIVEAGTGQQAIDLAITRHPRVIILDLGLPDLDGLEVLKTVRSNPLLAGTKVILATAAPLMDDSIINSHMKADAY